MASFNGISLGFIFAMPVSPNPNARQVNSYCGANGLEVINQGSRGGMTVLEGALIAPSALALGAAEQTFINLVADGGGYQLVDSLNRNWPNVILEIYRPKGKICQIIGPLGIGYIGRKYEMQFLHVY